MMFDKYCVDKILAGEKTVTRRIRRSERRPAIPGHTHKLKIDRTQKTFGEIEIVKCEPELLSYDKMDKIEAIKEGFNSVEEYIKYFNKINKTNLTKENCIPVWRIRFRLNLSKCEDCDKFYDCDSYFNMNQLIECYSK